MPAGVVQHKSVDAGAQISYGLAFSSAVAAGDTLVCVVFGTSSGDAPVSISDSVNGAWSLEAGSWNSDTGYNVYMGIYYFKNSAAGTPTVTVTFGASHEMAFAILELGSVLASPYDTTAEGSPATAGLSAVTGTFTTAQAIEIIVAGYVSRNAQTWTPPAGFTAIETFSVNTNAQVSYYVTSSVITGGTETVGYTSSDTALIMIAAFKAAAIATSFDWIPKTEQPFFQAVEMIGYE
jgi:hypothetical protein